jgi:hypothetical protein
METVMKKLFTVLMVGFLFILVSCDSGTKKETDKDLGTADTDVITDQEVTDQDSPAQGEEGGDCYPNGTCNEGLECVDGTCAYTEFNDESEFSDDYEDSDIFPDEDPDDSEEPDETFTPEEYTVDGFVQKGPFIKDSEIQITELDNNFEMIPNTAFTTKTIDDLGNFNIKRKFSSRYIEIKASGFYYNEVDGGVSSTQITNYVFVDLKANNSKISINILTTLARRRIQHLMKQGSGFNEAREQAEKEVLEIFGIFGEPAANFQDMDILKAGNSNAMLLAISARLQAGNTPGQLSVLTAGIIYEIEETGKLTNDALKTSISDGSVYIADKLTDIRNNLDTYFGSKTTVDIPSFEDYCDDDGNGIINQWDFNLDFGVVENAERDIAYIPEEKTVKVNPVTTAVAKTTLGTLVINGTDTGLNESPINDGDKLTVRVVSSNEFETTVKAVVSVEFTVNEGNVGDWTVSGSYSVTTGECDYDDIQVADNICGDGSGTREQKCIEGVWVNQGECTRVFNCSPKPTNSIWNSVDKYTQTWNGSAWNPADSATSNHLTASTTSCRFRCPDSDKFCYSHAGLKWSDRESYFTWYEANTHCQNLGARLPTISELRAIIKNCSAIEIGGSCGVTDSCLSNNSCWDNSCAGCPRDNNNLVKYNDFGETSHLWSSSVRSDSPSFAWCLNFGSAAISFFGRTSSTSARCVK